MYNKRVCSSDTESASRDASAIGVCMVPRMGGVATLKVGKYSGGACGAMRARVSRKNAFSLSSITTPLTKFHTNPSKISATQMRHCRSFLATC